LKFEVIRVLEKEGFPGKKTGIYQLSFGIMAESSMSATKKEWRSRAKPKILLDKNILFATLKLFG